MRDMIQNHLLQILCMIAMSPPSDLTADSIRDAKVKVLKSLRRIDRSNVREKTVRGQYTAGFARGKSPGYLEEEGANKSSNTETFVAIRVDIDDWRWAACRSTCVPGNVCRQNAPKWWSTSKIRN